MVYLYVSEQVLPTLNYAQLMYNRIITVLNFYHPGSETSGSPVPVPSTEGSSAPRPRITRDRASLVQHLGREWDTLVWVVAAFAVLYYTEFASTLLFDGRVKG